MRRQIRFRGILGSVDPPQVARELARDLFRADVQRTSQLLQQLMEQTVLGKRHDRVVLHAHQRRGGAQRVFGVDHHDPAVSQRLFLGAQRLDGHRLVKERIGQLEVGQEIITILDEVFDGPQRVRVGLTAHRTGQLAACDAQRDTCDAATRPVPRVSVDRNSSRTDRPLPAAARSQASCDCARTALRSRIRSVSCSASSSSGRQEES